MRQPAQFGGMSPSGFDPPRRPGSPRILGIPITVWLLGLAVFFLVRMFIALGDDGAGTNDPVMVAPVERVAEPEPTDGGAAGSGAGPADTAEARDDPDDALLWGRSPDDPIPSGDPEISRFVYSGFFGGWEGSVLGLVELEPRQADEIGGRCLAVIGTLEPVDLAGPVSDAFSTPSISLLVGDELVGSGVGECAVDVLEELGIGWHLEVEVTRGTTFAFHAEVVVPDSAGVRAIVLEGGSAPLYFEPLRRELDEIRSLAAGTGPLSPGRLAGPPPDVDLAPLGERVADSPLDGVVLGLVETGPGRFTSRTGRCMVALGVLEPTRGDDRPSVPPIALVVGGHVVPSWFGGCDTDAVEASGYVWWLDETIGSGERAPFYVEFVVPEWLPGDPQAILVGHPGPAPVAHVAEVSSTVPVP